MNVPRTNVKPTLPLGASTEENLERELQAQLDEDEDFPVWNSYQGTMTIKLEGIAQSSEDFFGAVVGVLKSKGMEGMVVEERDENDYPITIVHMDKAKITLKEVG